MERLDQGSARVSDANVIDFRINISLVSGTRVVEPTEREDQERLNDQTERDAIEKDEELIKKEKKREN